MSDKLIKIAYLYEDLMNTYGDSGDVKILSFLLKREGYDTQVDNISLGDDFNAFDYDFVFFGGGQDFEQTVVAKDLPRHKETLENTSTVTSQCSASAVATNLWVATTRPTLV